MRNNRENKIYQTNANKESVLATRIISSSGPLPPASEMERYNKLLPNAVDRIIKLAEEQQRIISAEHMELIKNNFETKKIIAKNAARSLNYLLIISLCLILGCLLLMIIDKYISGSIFGAVGLFCVVKYLSPFRNNNIK